MDNRKRSILKVITNDYIVWGEPVGSRTIARKYNLGLSPATIRNEMADLEEEGYLQQPHTSAGRIPSDRGYRYYVDALMERRRLRPSEAAAIKKEMKEHERAIGSIIRKAAHALSQFTRYPSLVTPPDKQQAVFRHVRLFKLNEHNVMVLMVADTGLVENRIIEYDENLDEVELERLSNLFDVRLRNRPIAELELFSAKEIEDRMIIGERFFHEALQAIVEGMGTGLPSHVFLDGAAQILDQPEFIDRDRCRPLLSLFEQEDDLCRLLMESADTGRLKVSIGQENKDNAMRDCSMVTSTYEIHDQAVGIIGVLGPTRMDYAKVLAVVEFMAAHISKILNDLAG